MELKLDESGHVVVSDGKPVYVNAEGREVAFDAAGTVATITRLNGEARGHREAKEAAEKALKSFEGITDPAAARKALETLSSLDQKRLIDAGEVDKVKAEIAASYQAKLDAEAAKNQKLEADLYSEKIGGSFARSKFIAEKLAFPADIAEARFGKMFSIEDGKVVATDHNGNRLYSRSDPGQLASFEEAFEMIIDAYPQKDTILRGTVGAGGGAGQGGSGVGAKKISQADFDTLDAKSRAAKMADGFVIAG